MVQNRLRNILLVIGDGVLMYLALGLTLAVRYLQVPSDRLWEQHFLPFTLLFVVWVIVFYINGLYDRAASNNDISFYNRILSTLAINFGIAAAYFYLLTDKLFDIKPQTVFFIYIAVYTLLFSIWRYAYNTLVRRPNLLLNVLIIGMNDEARELIKEIIKKPQLGYRIKAVVHDGLNKNDDLAGAKIYNSGQNLKQIISENKISTVVTVLDPQTNPKYLQQLFESLVLRLQFFDLPTFYEKLTGKIPVTNIGHIWFLENLSESEKSLYEILKRIFDIVFSLTFLIVSIPFLPFIALAVRIDSDGPIIFKQKRVGRLGKPFMAIKFRSMQVGAEKDGGPQWAQKNDPRVTRIGWFIRKTRIDEIPQLLNVLKGEMSVIGPRPERPEFVKQLHEIIPFYNERHIIKPGLTGWAQINYQYGASAADSLKKLQYDLFYVKNRSVPLDIGIALKTINLMLSGKGR